MNALEAEKSRVEYYLRNPKKAAKIRKRLVDAGILKPGATARKATELGKMGKAVGGFVGKAAAPVDTALIVGEATEMALDPEAREETFSNLERSADQPTLGRVVRGQGDPMGTLYGTFRALGETLDHEFTTSRHYWDYDKKLAHQKAAQEWREKVMPESDWDQIGHEQRREVKELMQDPPEVLESRLKWLKGMVSEDDYAGMSPAKKLQAIKMSGEQEPGNKSVRDLKRRTLEEAALDAEGGYQRQINQLKAAQEWREKVLPEEEWAQLNWEQRLGVKDVMNAGPDAWDRVEEYIQERIPIEDFNRMNSQSKALMLSNAGVDAQKGWSQ